MIADVCQINQTQLHSKNKLYSCYKKLLGELLKQNQAPGPERNSDEGSGMTTNTADYDYYYFGSGAFNGY